MENKEINEILWGEIPIDAPIITDSQRAAIKKFEPIKLGTPAPHGESSQTYQTRRTIDSNDIVFDPIVMHTIDLREYLRAIQPTVEFIQENLKNTENAEDQLQFLKDLPCAPDLPGFPGNYPFSGIKTKDRKKFCVKELGDFELSYKSVKILLLKSIAVILKHVGYDVAPERVLVILADILEDFLTKMLKILRIHYDDEMFDHKSDFMSPLEKTFHEMEIDGVKGLHEFYVQSVINVHDVLLHKCMDAYENYPIPKKKHNIDDEEDTTD